MKLFYLSTFSFFYHSFGIINLIITVTHSCQLRPKDNKLNLSCHLKKIKMTACGNHMYASQKKCTNCKIWELPNTQVKLAEYQKYMHTHIHNDKLFQHNLILCDIAYALCVHTYICTYLRSSFSLRLIHLITLSDYQ